MKEKAIGEAAARSIRRSNLQKYARGLLENRVLATKQLKKLAALDIVAVDAYDTGGISEATEKYIENQPSNET